uniref:Uncharacterized protein n=1 Tax=Anopheles melas TaxID=34690 RepID=A0A182U7S6_9DIPT
MEQELLELQEFTKLENSVETQHLKKELDKRTVELLELKHDLEKKEQRLEQLEERCAQLEIELKGQMATVSKAENDLALAAKERQAAVREAELHRNQHTGIEFEYERYRQRSEAREKELIESLQEARNNGATSNGGDSFKLDQKREEMKRLEMQNYEFTLQLEECNKQLEQLKSSNLEQHRKLETVKQAVLQHFQTFSGDFAQSALANSLRKLLLLSPEDGEQEHTAQSNGFSNNTTMGQSVHDGNGNATMLDGNATLLGEEKTIQELVKIVEQLEETVRTLEQEKRALQEASDVQLGELKSKLDGGQTSIERLEKEIAQWREKFAAQTTEYDELSTQLMDQMQDNEDLRKQFEEAKQCQVALANEKDVQRREELERVMGPLRESLEKANAEREALQRVCDSLREEVSALKAAIERHASQVETIVAEKEQLSVERDEVKIHLEEAIAQQKETMKELETVQAARQAEVATVNEEINRLKQEIVQLETSIGEQRVEKELLATENSRLSAQLVQFQQELKEQQQAGAASDQKAREDFQRLQQLKDEADGRVVQLEIELEVFKNKLNAAESEQNERFQQWEAEKQGLVKEIGDLQLRMEELQASLLQLREEKNSQTNLVQIQTEKESALQEELAVLPLVQIQTEKESALQEELAVLRQKQASEEARIHELQQKVCDYEGEIAALTEREAKQGDSFESSLKQVQEELDCARKALAQLTEEKDAIAAEEAKVREELLKAAQTVAELQKRIEEVEQELECSRSELSAIAGKQKEEQQNHEEARKEIEKQLETANTALAKIKEDNSVLSKRQHEDLEDQAQCVQALTKCKETLEQRLAEKEAELATVTSELETTRAKCETLAEEQKTEHESYNSARQQLDREIELLKQMVEQVSADKATVEREHSECHSRQQALQGQLEEREVEMLRYITELDALRAEQIRLVEQQNGVKRELEAKAAALQHELDSLQGNVSQLMNENEALLREQLEGEKSQQERTSADAEELLKLRSCRDESERLVTQLERDLATVRAELEMVRTELLEEKRRRDEIEQTDRERSDAVKEETERLRHAITALEDEKQRLQEATDRLRVELTEKERRTAELEALQQQKESALDEMRKENSDLTIAVQELSAKIVNLEEQVDSNEASQRKTIDTLVQERQEQDAALAALKQALTVAEAKLTDVEKQRDQVRDELRETKAALEESLAARLRLEADIEESSSVRDVLERELRDLKSDLESLDHKLANERYEQERAVSAGLRRELDEKRKELESFMATGRPSLGDGRVVQALRRENEDLLKQLNEVRQLDGLRARQLQERVDELERLEGEIAKMRDEMSSMRHESSFNEKVEEISHLQKQVQDAEKVREETVHQKRSLERAFDQLRFKHQSLAKEVDELRKTTDKERKNRRQSTHDDRRGLLFNSKEVSTITDPTSADCACSEMNEKIKEMRNKLTLKDCQLNTQKLLSSANPLKNEIAEMRRKLEEQHREKSQIEQELREVLEQLDQERKDRKRHCTQCMRHSRQQNARCDKAVQAYQPTTDSPSTTTAVSVSIVSTGRGTSVAVGAGDATGSAELTELQKRCEEQQQQYERLNEKYQTMKHLCRIRNDKISSLSAGLAEKENESTNVNRTVQNECIQLKQQLKEAENRYAQIYHHAVQMRGKSANKADVGLQTDNDVSGRSNT